ncbi:hypothetical protein ACDX78_14985 [Virgibacillus oceani]
MDGHEQLQAGGEQLFDGHEQLLAGGEQLFDGHEQLQAGGEQLLGESRDLLFHEDHAQISRLLARLARSS